MRLRFRLAAAAVAVASAAVAGGCAPSRGPSTGPSPVAPDGPGSTATSATTAAGQSTGAVTTAAGALTRGRGSATVPGPPAPAPGPGGGAADPDAGGPGELARGLLRPSPYSRLAVQVDVAGDAAPPASVTSRLTAVLSRESGKPVELVAGGALPGRSGGCWSDADVRSTTKARRRVHTAGATATLYVLFLDGTACEDSGVLGETYAASAFAVFADATEQAAPPTVDPARFLESVTVHELGHTLGLVNIGYHSRIDHEDPAHPHHSTNEQSVMYWKIERGNLIQQLLAGPSVDFDQADESDLAGLRSGQY